MGTVLAFADKLINALTGTGTGRDVRTANTYVSRPLTQAEIAAAYSGSGLMRKIVQIPALDMVREWRDWTGLDDTQAAAVFDEEKRLGLRQKVRQAEVLRDMGGGALILGLPGTPSQPAPPTVTKAGLAFVHVVSRWHLTFDALQDDATQPGYGEPLMWQMTTKQGQASIHPSRVIPFRADTTASLAMPMTWGADDAFWGESKVQQVLDAVQDNDTARAAFAALINKARLLRLGIPGLMDLASTEGGTAKVQARLQAVVLGESIHNATIFDAGDNEGKGGETIVDATYNFAGAKDMLGFFAEFVAAISDIPATRLLGRAPEGLNSSGESQQEDWDKVVRARQTLELGPCMDRLDPYLIQSATGGAVAEAACDWAPLDTPDQKEDAERFKLQMEAIEKLINSGAIPDRAMARGVQSLLIEEGYLPELEAALAEIPDEEKYGLETEGGDPDDLDGEGGDPMEAVPPSRAANDGAEK
jgi:phage-related protein (TIGR01555 family)